MENPERAGESQPEPTPEEQERQIQKKQAERLGLRPDAPAKEIAETGLKMAEAWKSYEKGEPTLDIFDKSEIAELERKAPTKERLSQREILLARTLLRDDINSAAYRAHEILNSKDITPEQRKEIISDLNEKLDKLWEMMKNVVPEHADQQMSVRTSIRDSLEALHALDKDLEELEKLPSIEDTEKQKAARAREEIEASSAEEPTQEPPAENERPDAKPAATVGGVAGRETAGGNKKRGFLGRFFKRNVENS